MRFDVALHELRLFKSRTQSSEAIRSGAARIGGQVVKPSHELRVGDRITLRLGTHERTVEVLGLPARALSKDAAKELLRDVTA